MFPIVPTASRGVRERWDGRGGGMRGVFGAKRAGRRDANRRQTTDGGRRERAARVESGRRRDIGLIPSFAGCVARRSSRTTRRREVGCRSLRARGV